MGYQDLSESSRKLSGGDRKGWLDRCSCLKISGTSWHVCIFAGLRSEVMAVSDF